MNLNLHFANPHMLWLALLVPPLMWSLRYRVTTAAVRYPSVRHLRRLPRSFRQRTRFVLPLAQALALLLLVVVLARPVRQIGAQEMPSEGIAIGIVLDRSGSMGDPNNKLMFDGKLELRFKAAKQVFERFVQGDGQKLAGRPNDLIGLVTFATYPRMDYPFSPDHVGLVNVVEHMSFELPFIDRLGNETDDPRRAVARNPMQMTDLKKALEYAADKFSLLADDLGRDSAGVRKYDLKSKVLLLLTDNEPNIGNRGQADAYPDEDTIKKLVDAGIKVYFVQLLSDQVYRERPDGTVEILVPTNGRGVARLVNQSIDEARKLARRTGGEYFLATSGDQLEQVYEQIDHLERSDVGGRAVFAQEEWYRPFLLAAIALLAGEALLSWTYFRRSP